MTPIATMITKGHRKTGTFAANMLPTRSSHHTSANLPLVGKYGIDWSYLWDNGPTFNGRPGADYAFEMTGTAPPGRSIAAFGYDASPGGRLVYTKQ